MTDSAIEARPDGSAVADLLIAVALPLALFALAYALWAISDRLLVIGPFDRAAFGWIVVLPLSWLAPGLAGIAWSRMPTSRRVVAAVVVAVTVALVSGGLLANAIEFANCRPVASWTDVLPGSLAIGVVIGIGPALGALAAASVAANLDGWGRVVAAVLTGGLIGFVGLFAAIITFLAFFPPISCGYVP